MLALRRKALALLTALGLFLLVVQLKSRPFNAGSLRSFLNATHAEGLFEDQPDPSTITVRSKTQTQPTSTETLLDTTSETSPAKTPEKVLVVASLKWEDTNWVLENFPDWQTAIYTVDDPDAAHHTSMNKGREANVYLTYIIENYSNFPSTIVFLHSHRNHDHGSRDVENIDFDNVAAIKALQIAFVQRTGYANLRCILNPGCPAEIQPFRPVEESDPLRPQEAAMAGAWTELFGNSDVPKIIAAPCCAQFAVSRDQVLKRSKGEYERYLKWLLDTPLNDFTSGRVFEYLWHVIFGREPVFCPETEQCYKDLYNNSPASSHSEELNTNSNTSSIK